MKHWNKEETNPAPEDCEHMNKTVGPLIVVDQGKVHKFMIELEGMEKKSKSGANAILDVS